MTTIYPDDNLRDADWIKTLTWDLPTDPAEFTQAGLVRLSKLPAWEAAPPQIRAALGDPSKTKDGNPR